MTFSEGVGLCRDAAVEGGAVGHGEQERPQRRARDRTDGSGKHAPPGSCQGGVEPRETDAPDQSQVHVEAAVRRGGQHPRHAAELRDEDGQSQPPRARSTGS